MDSLRKERGSVYSFSEHNLTVSGEKEDLLDLARYLMQVDITNTWADLIYKITLAFDDEFRREVSGGEDDVRNI